MLSKKWKVALSIIGFIFLLSFIRPAQAQNSQQVVLSDRQEKYPLGDYLEIFEDPSMELTIDQVSSPEYREQFHPLPEGNTNYGYTRPALWVRFKVINSSSSSQKWLLELGDARIGRVDLYLPSSDQTGFIQKSSGFTVPFVNREIPYYQYVFEVPLSQGVEQEVYLRLQTNLAMNFPLTLWVAEAFYRQNQGVYFSLGLFYCMIVVMILYNLFLFAWLRERSYLYYVLFLLFFTIGVASREGIAQQFLWPKWAIPNSVALAGNTALIFVILFTRNFLNTKQYLPRLDRGFSVLAIVSGGAILLIPFVWSINMIFNILIFTIFPLLILSGILVWKKGYKPARFYVASWTVFLSIVIIFGLTSFGVIPFNILAGLGYRISFIILITVLALALADRINLFRMEAEQANVELKTSENRIIQFLDALPLGIIVQTTKALPLFVNRMARNYLRVLDHSSWLSSASPKEAGEVLSTLPLYIANTDQVYPIDHLPPTLALQGRPAVVEDIEAGLDGQRVPLEIHSSPVYNDIGELEYAITTFRDISMRRKAELALQESQARLAEILTLASEAIISIDDQQCIFLFNEEAGRIFGYDAEDVMGKPLDMLIPEIYIASYWKDFVEFASSVSATPAFWFQGEITCQRKNGEHFPAEASISKAVVGNQTIYTTILHDITERKKSEEELRIYQEHLEELVLERTSELDRSREQLAMLYDASQVINAATLDPEQIFDTIHSVTARLLPSDIMTIALIEPIKDEVKEVYFADSSGNRFRSQRPENNSLTDRLLENNHTIRVADFSVEKDQVYESFGDQGGTRSGLAAILKVGNKPIGIFTTQSLSPNAYNQSDQDVFESLAAHVSIVLENVNLHKIAQKKAVDEERQRLARELHDSVTQLLYSMVLMSGGWSKSASQNRLEDPAASFGQLESIGQQALKEMRLLIHQLRSPVLEEVGLVEALQQRLGTVERRVNIETIFSVEGDLPEMPAFVEEQLYGIAQEALNNVLRHANAKTVNVHLRVENRWIELTIQDDGIGFDTSALSTGMGLISLQERAKSIGAQISVNSQPMHGTEVHITLGL